MNYKELLSIQIDLTKFKNLFYKNLSNNLKMTIKLMIRILNFYIILKSINGEEFLCLDSFIEYVKNEKREQQVLLLSNLKQRHESLATQIIIKKFTKNLNVQQISVDKMNSKLAQKLSKLTDFNDPRTTMMVIILSKGNENFQKTLQFLTEISEAQRRSRYFLISVEQQEFDFKKLLTFMWRKKILDATILEFAGKTTSSTVTTTTATVTTVAINAATANNTTNDATTTNAAATTNAVSATNASDTSTATNATTTNTPSSTDTATTTKTTRIENPFSNNLQEFSKSNKNAFVHHYNPFRKLYQRLNYTKNIVWFPEKDHNLHKLVLKVGILDYSPYIIFDEVKNGTVTNPRGNSIVAIEGLSQAMNFEILWKADVWGFVSCKKEKSAGLLKQLLFDEINLIGLKTSYFQSCPTQMLEWTKDGSRVIGIGILVPNFPGTPKVIVMYDHMLQTCIIFLLFLLTWELFRSMSHDKKNLQILELVSIALSMSSVINPRRPVERVFFTFILIACFVFSCDFFTMLSSFSLKLYEKKAITTIDDVVETNLRPLMTRGHYRLFEPYSQGNMENLMKKGKIDGNCLEHFFLGENVACIQRLELLDLRTRNVKDQCGEPIAKLVREIIVSSPSTIILQPASPFLGRFEKLERIFSESGILDKWFSMNFLETSYQNRNENQTQSCDTGESEHSLNWLLFAPVFIGYCVSIIVFIYEIVYNCIKIK